CSPVTLSLLRSCVIILIFFSFLSALFSFFSFFFLILPPPPRSTLFPYTTLFRSHRKGAPKCPAVTRGIRCFTGAPRRCRSAKNRSEEHTSELQSPYDLVCRLLLEKKKKKKKKNRKKKKNIQEK